MALLSTVVFASAVVAITALFEIKRYEEKRGVLLFGTTARAHCDRYACMLKDKLSHSGAELQKVPPIVLHYARIGIHEVALALAAGARFMESQAHALADMVSHKHHFEHRETQSEFLIRMAEHKQGRARPQGFDVRA